VEGLNLLPWRELQREDKKRQFIVMIVTAILLGIFFIILGHTLVARKIQQQESVNHFLQTEIKQLDQNITEIDNLKQRKQLIMHRLELMYQLQASRPLFVKAYDELVRIIPSGLYIASINRKENTLIVKGYSESIQRISELMKNAEHSKWFKRPQLQEVKTSNKNKNYQREFTLKLTLASIRLYEKSSKGNRTN